jgi:hypothetical protein
MKNKQMCPKEKHLARFLQKEVKIEEQKKLRKNLNS